VAADGTGRRLAAAGHVPPAPVPFAGFGDSGGGGSSGGGGGGGLLGGLGDSVLTAKKVEKPAAIHLWEAMSS
jgi:hypothetical protein